MKQLRITVLTFLGLAAFLKNDDGKEILTGEQKETITGAWGEEFASGFIASLQSGGNDEAAATVLATQMSNFTAAQVAQVTALSAKVLKLENDITTLAREPEPDKKPAIVALVGKWVPSGKDTHLYASGDAIMAIDGKHPYNQRAYASLASRHGLMIPTYEASSTDYTSLGSDLGEYNRIRKQDGIQSFLVEQPTLEGKIFQLESGYQDQADLVNMFLTDDFSQSDSTALGSTFDNVVKGGYKFEPEVLTMYDVMFAHVFTQLKTLEKTWIGYLNKEGSSTMKMSFIEYILVETAKKLRNEQELRRVRGIRVNPTVNVPGTALGAANGLLKFLKNQIALFKLRPFALGEWTAGTICDYVYRGTQMVPQTLRDTGRIVLYMSTDAHALYLKGLRLLWGENTDFKAPGSKVFEYPEVEIIPIPGMSPSQRMIWTFKGNIALFEDKPQEMLSFNIEQRDWSLKVWSNWRESIWAYRTGRKFASLAEIPEDYSTQLLFLNDVDDPATYYTAMAHDDATPSVANHTSLVTVSNTSALAITNIDDAVVGQEIRIKWGAGTNLPTIAKSGNFSTLPAAISAPEVGDILTLKKRSDGKFIQVSFLTTAQQGAVAFADGDATPSVLNGVKFVTVANTGATAITTFDDAVQGVVFTVWGGSNTNSSTIANSGNFSLTAAMTLGVGTYIVLEKMQDGKFWEITRG